MTTQKVKLYKSPRKGKKYRAVWFEGNEPVKHTDFGAEGMSDYTINKDASRMKRYLDRHRKRENWNDPYSAGALSRWVLWNKPSLRGSWLDYKKRFGFR
jgi:hypothetical protein